MYKNVLRNPLAKASASSVMSGTGYVAANAIDGSGSAKQNNFRWVSNESAAGAWFQVDIGVLAEIDKYILYTGNSGDGVSVDNAIQNADFQVNKNGEWVTVHSFRKNASANYKVEGTFSPVITDKVRLYFPVVENQHRIFELEVYGETKGKQPVKKIKNMLYPFTNDWNPDADSNVNILEVAPDRVVMEMNNTRQYTGLRMRINMDNFKDALGKVCTLSAKSFVKPNSNSQIHLRFYSASGGQKDFVLNANLSVTGVVPADAYNAFICIQNNVTGYLKLTVEQLQFEVGSQRSDFEVFGVKNKLAKLQSENLLPPLTDSRWYVAYGQTKGEIRGDYDYFMSIDTDKVVGMDIDLPLEVGQTYTLSADAIGENARIRVVRRSDTAFLANLNSTNSPLIFTASSSDTFIRIENNNKAGQNTIKNFMLAKGSNSKQKFKPYKLETKKASLVPKENLLKPFTSSDWVENNLAGISVAVDSTNEYRATFTGQTSQGKTMYVPVEKGKTYSFSFVGMPTPVVYRLYKGKYNYHIDSQLVVQDNNNVSFTVDGSYNGFVSVRIALVYNGTGVVNGLMLTEGSPQSFKPYELAAKKASLVTGKNLFDPNKWTSGRIFDAAFRPTRGIRVDGNDVIIDSDVNSFASQIVDVKPYTNYTISHVNGTGLGIYIYSLSGTDLSVASKASPVTFNSGNNAKLIIGLYKSTELNSVPTAKIVEPMMEEGSAKTNFAPYRLGNKPAIWS